VEAQRANLRRLGVIFDAIVARPTPELMYLAMILFMEVGLGTINFSCNYNVALRENLGSSGL
jgi:hypothetical protein